MVIQNTAIELKYCLDLRGHSVVGVSSGADVPRSTLYRYLHGDAPRIHPEHGERLARFLGTTREMLEEDYRRNKNDLVELRESDSTFPFLLGDQLMNDNLIPRRAFTRAAIQRLFFASSFASLLASLNLQANFWTKLTQAVERPTTLDQETLAGFERLTTACWSLSDQGKLQEVETLLATFLPSVVSLARQDSSLQVRLAALASQGYQLLYVIASHEEEFKSALTHSRQAQAYARIAQDPNLEAAAVIRQGVVHLHRKSPRQTLRVLEQILPLQDGFSPLIRSRFFANLSEVQAKLQMKQEALSTIRLSEEAFPDDPASDPSQFIHFRASSIPLHEALALLDLHQPARANEVLAKVDLDTLSKRSQIDVMNQQGYASIALGERDQVVLSLQRAVPLAREHGSDLRKSESWDVLSRAQEKWPTDRVVKNLMQLF